LGNVDIEPLFGLAGTVQGRIPGLRCASCGAETVESATFERLRTAVARVVLSQPQILSAAEARFVRKAALGLTQDQLAKRMGIHAVTVADWERGERLLSKEHDYELRGIALARLLELLSDSLRPALTQEASKILTGSRSAGPRRKRKTYVIDASDVMAA
jgi:DNA-binding transcriptional regulator YiaG